jgi:carbamate kinase
MKKLAVVAIGGNSLIKDENHTSVKDQYEALRETSRHIASMIQMGYETIITHGNGPQVGFMLLRSELAKHVVSPVSLDTCDADTQGSIGYNIQMALGNEFRKRNIRKKVVTLITQVVVNKNDPAFKNPTKPIGPFYSKREAEERKKIGWIVKEDAGRGYRRVVPSPTPKRIVEIDIIRNLVNNGFVVIATGGGGIPVILENGCLKGIEAVIDKDFASSLLAFEVKAHLFLISTAVEKVYLNFSGPNQTPISKMDIEEARKHLAEGHFAEGSMAPKIKACISFLERGGNEAIITSPNVIEKALEGKTGTRIYKV